MVNKGSLEEPKVKTQVRLPKQAAQAEAVRKQYGHAWKPFLFTLHWASTGGIMKQVTGEENNPPLQHGWVLYCS